MIRFDTHKDHTVVGRRFRGFSIKDGKWKTWFCESWTSEGFWMQATDRQEDVICISERAIGRTFFEIFMFDHSEFADGGYHHTYETKGEVVKL